MGALRARVEPRRLHVVDGTLAMEQLGSTKVLNVVLLGVAARTGALGLTPDDMAQALRQRLPQRLWDLNLRALAWG